MVEKKKGNIVASGGKKRKGGPKKVAGIGRWLKKSPVQVDLAKKES